MLTQRLATILVLGLLLAACGRPSANDEEREASKPSSDGVSREMFRPLEKARGVEDTTMQHKRDMDRAIDANEGSAEQ